MTPELQLAYEITKYLHLVLPDGAVHFHVPNEGRRSRYEQTTFLMSGGKAGIPDRWIVWGGKVRCWEEKSLRGVLSDSQKKLFPRLEEQMGNKIPIVRSLEDAERTLIGWNIPLKHGVK